MMSTTAKQKDPLPETFVSYEDAGEFWDTHDSTDYLEDFIPVNANVKLLKRHYEIEIEEDVMKVMEREAHARHISIARLANTLLKRQLALQ